ncbi:MAG TPA: chorismate synthase [Acidobacteriota bacterium]|nr:chorismate synthase [Acidobacteriota bacterium]
MLRFLTAGESHGRCLTGIIEGLPGGISIDVSFINGQLHRRQLGYGRGGRMKIERDSVHITSGVRHGLTLGSPIAFTIENRDWDHWRLPMSIEPVPVGTDVRRVTHPRPGHADLAGVLKYQTFDVRNVLERASARETAVRVAVGAFCRLLLSRFGIEIGSHTVAVGKVRVGKKYERVLAEKIFALNPSSRLRCVDAAAEKRMVRQIEIARAGGDTLGGISEIVAVAIPSGLGSHVQWDRRLDGQIAQAMMSIPAIKAVELGCGIAAASRFGSSIHDEIFYDDRERKFLRHTNNAGGLEGGITNGEELRIRIYVKPIPTLRKALNSVDIDTKCVSKASVERSDVCVVPSAGIVAEAMLAIVLTGVFLEKFGGDSLREIQANYDSYQHSVSEY